MNLFTDPPKSQDSIIYLAKSAPYDNPITEMS